MEQYTYHPSAKFEGYYTRFMLDSGSSLIFILCTVPKAPEKAHMASLTYVSPTGKIWQQQKWLDNIKFHEIENGKGFCMVGKSAEGDFSLNVGEKETTVIHKTDEVDFTATTKKHTRWSAQTNSPESWLSWLPLPLHWHVYSLASNCHVQLQLPAEANALQQDSSCDGISHQEKNWANDFPSSHIWMQARTGGQNGSGITLAGGKILGMQAFLVGYRNTDRNIAVDFRPPFALRALGLGPFMSYTVDWEGRTFSMTVQDLTRKLEIKASAPKGTFYPLSSPYSSGHKENWLSQSLMATVNVKVSKSEWGLKPWEVICEEKFEKGALEFGGEFFPLRGSEQKWN